MTTANELVWKLRGYTPETIPMARLAEYMRQLAILLGEPSEVRFLRVEKGSLGLVTAAVRGSAGNVNRRIDAVRRGDAPRDAMSAYHTINEMVGEDGGPANLSKGSAVVIRFPGAKQKQPSAIKLIEQGRLVGKLYALYESTSGSFINARIRPADGGNAVICTADRSRANSLREVLFEAVQVFGMGTWARSDGGAWTCETMAIEKVNRVQNVTLREAVDRLRALEVEWPDDPIAEMAMPNGAGGAA